MIIHGGNIYGFAEEIGIDEKKIIDFSASINPLGIPKIIRNEIGSYSRYLANYPDPDAKKLRHKIAGYYGIKPDTILCGNGSTELIYLIPRVLKPKKVLIPVPTFSEYERACKTSNGLRVTSYELKKANDFGLDPDKFISAMKRFSSDSKLKTQNSKLIFLCNPNNPTGRLLKRNDVLQIAGAAKKLKCYLVVDEAFIDFCPEDSVINEVKNNPYLIVLRSMTKFYALSGLRIGYGVFPEHLIPVIKEYKEPWTVNSLAQWTGLIAIGETGYRDKTIGLIKKEKQFLENNFKKIGIKFYPSDVNFYLLKIIPPNPPLTKGGRGDFKTNMIVQRLNKKGILVRDCSNFKGLDNTFIRVAVRSHRENTILLKELAEISKKIRKS
ncbi:MAG: threonine-phosphate decarboxylase [Nitrospirae bacterium]|nr:threonine-phosphate decarboxylase [Nitrospirota bacterium]